MMTHEQAVAILREQGHQEFLEHQAKNQREFQSLGQATPEKVRAQKVKEYVDEKMKNGYNYTKAFALCRVYNPELFANMRQPS